MNDTQTTQPNHSNRVVSSPLGAVPSFWQTTAGPDDTPYPAKSEHPTVYYAERRTAASYLEEVGSRSLDTLPTGEFRFIKLQGNDSQYIPEGTIVLCFEFNGILVF